MDAPHQDATRRIEVRMLALPPNAGHMAAVYAAACPAVETWWERCLTEGAEMGSAWDLTGGGMRVTGPSQRRGYAPRLLTGVAATDVGGKAVNQDAAGWFLARPPDGGGAIGVACVADGVTASPYSEFGAAMAAASAVRAARQWGATTGGTPLGELLLTELAECRRAMGGVADLICGALAGVLEGSGSAVNARAKDEAHRQLDFLKSGHAEALCTTVVVVAANARTVTGAAIGNGGMYFGQRDSMQAVWWDVACDCVEKHVGVATLPGSPGFAFESPWSPASGDVVGVVTDGVGNFEPFRESRHACAVDDEPDEILARVVAQMRRSGVAAEFIDNLAMAELRQHVTRSSCP